jgi:DNA-binding GntR family transcriptional regulator
MPRLAQPLIRMPEPPPDIAARLPLSDRCEQYLRGLLLDGGLTPNDPLSVEAVAATLNVSRQPAMEAVKRLAADGFVAILPQIGCRVVQPEPDHVADFYRLFAPAEALVARLAAERRTPQEAADFVALSRRIAAEASQPGGDRALGRLRYAALHGMARSPIAAGIVAGLWDRSDFYVRAAFGALSFSDAAIRAHAAIANAVGAGDAAAAEAETLAYLTEVGARTAERLRLAFAAKTG